MFNNDYLDKMRDREISENRASVETAKSTGCSTTIHTDESRAAPSFCCMVATVDSSEASLRG